MQSFKGLILFFFSFSIGAFLSGILFFFLPKMPLFYTSIKKEFNFYYINLPKIFFNKTKKIELKNQVVLTLKGVKLKAIYSNSNKGFIIIEDNKKTKFLNLNDTYKGYKLIKIGNNYALFKNGSNLYKITLEKVDLKSIKSSNSSFVNVENTIKLKKDVVNSYIKNFNKIWQNIGIIKVKKGYMITYIAPKSIFSKIGLKRGDIIVEVNGKKLKSDADAWEVYRNINKFNIVEIKILRKNQEKVLYYEVD